ncbi:MAG: hypothetical protein ACRDRX_09820 [Pseudonocardiaceae bacterium]
MIGFAHVVQLTPRFLDHSAAGARSQVFDAVGSDDAKSDYAVPWWRFNVFISLLAARLGHERL